MQKSKKMMVSLCGLALSSLFVLNNKSVVHADTVDGSQNNAISWNSDSDTAQGVQNTQKADDHQQNAAQPMQSRAETSNVESSSAAPRTTNQTAAVQSSKISNINDAQAAVPVVINNPANNKVHVHYVDRNGNAVDNSGHDYDIDAAKTGQGQYNVPTDSKGNKYQLNYPDGKYTVSGGAFNGTNLKATVDYHRGQTRTVHHDEVRGGHNVDFGSDDEIYAFYDYEFGYKGKNQAIMSESEAVPVASFKNNVHYLKTEANGDQWYSIDDSGGFLSSNMVGSVNGWLDSERGNHYSSRTFDVPRSGIYVLVPYENTSVTQPAYDETVTVSPAYTTQTLPVAFVDSNNNIVGMIQNYSGKVGTTQNVSLTVPTGYKLADGVSLPTSVTFAKSDAPLLIKVTSNGQINSVQNPANNTINVNFVDQETHKSVGTAAIDLTKQQQGTNYYQTPNGWATDNNGRYDVGTPFSRGYLTITDDKGNNAQQLILNAKQAQDFFEAFRKGHDTDLSIQAHLPASHPDEINLQDLAYNGVSTFDKENGDRSWENIVYNATKKVIQTETNRHMTDNYGQGVFDGYYGKITAKRYNAYTFTDNYHPYDASTNTVTVPVHKTNSFSFADNSGNVQSVNGNTVDVTLTKPQSVNPAMDTRCQAQATRTIQINFPDGQVPKSYDGIVDKSGKLVQTVHFTRTATEDALTGNILQYGDWTSDNQDHNFLGFEARTLPRIPGYTLSIKPV